MTEDAKNMRALIKTMRDNLLELQRLVNQDQAQQADFLAIVKIFLLNVVSTTISLAGIHHSGCYRTE